MIKSCTCKHEFQDTKYGVGKRVHNPLQGKGADGKKTRCTVCAKVDDPISKK